MITCYQHAIGNAPASNMVIIKHYSLEHKQNSDFFYVRSKENSHCPYCEGCFKVIGSRKRILFMQDDTKIHLIIRRLRCQNCQRISHELPDVVVPYKRYESDAVASALVTAFPETEDDCPAEYSTISRWKLWFFLLHEYIESSVRALMELWHCTAFVMLPLYPLTNQTDGWLKILVRNLVNSGRWRQTRSA